MSGPHDERRKHPRIDCIVQISIENSGEVSLLNCTNISAGGIKIELDRLEMPSVEIGTKVSVRLDLGSDKHGRPLDVDAEAEVVRIERGGPDRQPGFGLMWTSEDAEVARQLAVILEYLHPE